MKRYIDLDYEPGENEVVAKYYVEPIKGKTLVEVANHIAGESSIDTWSTITTLSETMKDKLMPHVFEIDEKKKIVKIAYHPELFEEGNMPQILSAIAGNIYGMAIVKNLRLIDFSLPENYVKSFPGPQFGISGVRKILGVEDRPLVGTIVKPKVGLSVKEHTSVGYESWAGGCDAVKDDENLTSQPFNKFEQRIPAMLEAMDKAKEETGEKKVYFPNITSSYDKMLERYDYVKEQGGNYIMVDILTAGFGALSAIRKVSKLPIHGHRAMHGAITRNKKHGMSMLALAKISRLLGIDTLHIGAIFGKMEGGKSEVMEIEHEIEANNKRQDRVALKQPWYRMKKTFAVASGGVYPGVVPKIIQSMGKDVVIQAGGGISGHKDGIRKGATAMRQAVDASMEKISLNEYAKDHKELKTALDQWGQ